MFYGLNFEHYRSLIGPNCVPPDLSQTITKPIRGLYGLTIRMGGNIWAFYCKTPYVQTSIKRK